MTFGPHPRLAPRFEFWVVVGVGCAIVLSAMMGLLAWVSASNAARDARWIAQIQVTRNGLDECDAHLVDVRLYARGYTITTEPPLLDSYLAASKLLQADIENLRRLAGNDARRRQQVDQLAEGTGHLVAFTQLIIARKQAGRPLPDGEQWKESTRLTNVTRTQLREMEAAEAALLEQRTDATERAGQRTLKLVVSGTLLGITSLLGAGFMLQREVRISWQARERLRTLNTQLEQRVEERTCELQAKQESLREQARILDLTQVLVCDLDGRIVMWSKGAEELYGLTGAEAVGQIAHDLLHSEFPEPLARIVETVQSTGKWDGEILQRTRSGTRVVVASQWILHCEQNGRPARISQSNTDITSRKQLQEQLLAHAGELGAQAEELARTEQALREQTLRLQMVLESMSEGLVAADPSGHFLLWNAAADRILGLPLKNLPSEQWPSYYGLYLPDKTTSYPAQELPLAQAITGCDVEAEIFVRNHNRPDGIWIEVSARPIKNAENVIVGSVAIFRDTTERKRTERALRSLTACNESLLRGTDELTLLQEICDLVVDVGSYRMAWVGYAENDAAKSVRPVAQSGFVSGYLDNLNVTWANEERGHGPTGTAIRTARTTVCQDMQSDPLFAPWREKALSRGYRSSMVLPLKSGESVLGAISIYAAEVRAFDQNAQDLLEQLANNFGYGIMALRAREESRHANDKLRSAHQRLLDIVEFLPDATLVVDKDGRVIAWNRAIEQMTGVPKQDILGKGGCAYAVPFYGSPHPMLVDLLQSENKAIEARYSNFQRRDRFVSGDIFIPSVFAGKGAHLFVTAAALLDPEGNYCGAIESIRDVTDRKRGEDQLRQINLELDRRVQQRTAELAASVEELEAFTYSVSHDLRAPLRHMAGFSKILIEDFSAILPAAAHRHLERIAEGTTRMGTLVDELLNLSRVQRQAANIRITSLNELISEVIAILQPETTGRQIDWKIADLPPTECDPTLVRQVFQNLLANALKFSRTRAQAVIEVGQTVNRGRAAIFVRDNGVGFDMKYADRLFGVFQRLHQADEFEGTGIGLATVQRIIKKHGGEIWVEAVPDKGATLYFTLSSRQKTETDVSTAAGGTNHA